MSKLIINYIGICCILPLGYQRIYLLWAFRSKYTHIHIPIYFIVLANTVTILKYTDNSNYNYIINCIKFLYVFLTWNSPTIKHYDFLINIWDGSTNKTKGFMFDLSHSRGIWYVSRKYNTTNSVVSRYISGGWHSTPQGLVSPPLKRSHHKKIYPVIYFYMIPIIYFCLFIIYFKFIKIYGQISIGNHQ